MRKVFTSLLREVKIYEGGNEIIPLHIGSRSTVFFVGSAAGIWVDPNSFDVNIVEGTTLTETLTIGNDGLGDLIFVIRTRVIGSTSQSARGFDSTSTAGKDQKVSVTKDHDFTVAGNHPYKQGELIVRFAPKAYGKHRSKQEKNQILSSLGGTTIKREFRIVPGLSVVQLPPGMTVEDALPVFNNTDGILYAEPDYEVTVCSTIPNDTLFNELWGMHNTGQSGGTLDADIDAPEAWDIARAAANNCRCN